MRYIALILLVLALGACSSAPATPTAQAAALLAKTGATASNPAYMAGPETNGPFQNATNECSAGAAEADGTLPAGNDIYVCVFPSSADLLSWLNGGTYAAGSRLIQVGQTAMIEVDSGNLNPPPASLVNSIASKTGGSVYSG